MINLCEDKSSSLEEKVHDEEGEFLSLDDGFGYCMVFNLSPEQIIEICQGLGINAFIWGKDPAPSIPYFYQKDKKGVFQSIQLEPIIEMSDLESIAPNCSEIWEDLYFNDYFRECLYNDRDYNW